MEKPIMRGSQIPTGRLDSATRRQPTRATDRQPAPTVLGRYKVSRRLGAGGFGTVWLAHDERLDREVAIKILPRERIVGGRFEREARATARLSHPGIVTLYEAAVDDEGAYLVSELVRGTTLDGLLADGRLSDRDVLDIGIALCDALHHAHAHGIVHRDVKPSNVLVPEQHSSPAQIAKLTDFGVARVVGGDSLTRTGDVIGTAGYMSPEQAEGLEAGPPADLYSLALVLYEALTGVNPLRSGLAVQRARRLGAHLPPLRRQRRDLPRELGQGIDLALRPRPRERGTIEELRHALQVSLERVDDTAGIVASPWPALTREHDLAPLRAAELGPPARAAPADEPAQAAEEAWDAAAPLQPRRQPDPWPARATAAVATGAVAAWLAAHLLVPSTIAPAAAAVLSGGLTLAVPRIGWVLSALAFIVATAAQGHPGYALTIGVGAVVPLALLPRAGTSWSLSAGAPALAALLLAGAWPALAGRASGPWRRAGLGAAGWIWLVLAGPLTGASLYVHRVPGTPPPATFGPSLHETVHLVLWPLVHTGVLAAAGVWALAAVTLPWMVRGRSPALDLIRVTVWAATVASATATVVGGLSGSAGLIDSRAAVIGAVASGLVALVPTVLAAWWMRRYADSRPGLA